MSRLRFSVLMLVSVCLIVPAARATTVPEMGLRDMVSAAPSIVFGAVESSTSRWNEDRSLIVTDVRIRVIDVLKGREVGEIVITQPGGQVGKLRVDVDGAAAYGKGDEAVLFLTPDPRGHQQVLGLFRGRFDVATDQRSGKKSIHGIKMSDLQQLQAAKPGLVSEPAPASGTEQSVALDDFLNGVRSMVQTPKGGK